VAKIARSFFLLSPCSFVLMGPLSLAYEWKFRLSLPLPGILAQQGPQGMTLFIEKEAIVQLQFRESGHQISGLHLWDVGVESGWQRLGSIEKITRGVAIRKSLWIEQYSRRWLKPIWTKLNGKDRNNSTEASSFPSLISHFWDIPLTGTQQVQIGIKLSISEKVVRHMTQSKTLSWEVEAEAFRMYFWIWERPFWWWLHWKGKGESVLVL